MMTRAKAGYWAMAAGAGLAILYAFPPTQYPIYPRCPFFALTHLQCPGCGGTRAVYELLHMNVQGALHYNALVTVLAPLVLIWLAWGWYRAFRFGTFPVVPWPRTVAVSLGTMAIVFAVIRDAGLMFST